MKQYYTIIFCLITLFTQAQSWQITTMNPAPERITNNAVAEGWVGTTPYIYTFGGLDSTKLWSGIHLRSYRFNTQTNIWSAIASLPDTLGKIAAGANRVKDKIYIIGGYHVYSNGGEASSNKVHIYDPATNTYLPDGAAIPVAIDDQVQAVWKDSLIYVITGWSNTGNVANVQIYNPTTDAWAAGTGVGNNNVFRSFGASGAIVGDTIYYFGGASMSGSFNIQSHFRRGIINPTDPTQINWASFNWGVAKGYRMAATTAFGKVFWIGGSDVTYNYNGIAYNGTGGVSPNGRILYYEKSDHSFDAENGYNLPMDLRGIGNVSDTVKYLVGGMEAGQQVTAQTLRLTLEPDSLLMTSVVSLDEEVAKELAFQVSPNPVKDLLTVDLANFEADVTYEIYSTSGVCLKRGVLTQKESQVNLSELISGVYLLHLNGQNAVGGAVMVKK